MISTDPFDQMVAARLSEYWAWFTPWHRRLWNTGTIASLRELLEAAESAPEKAIGALKKEVDRFTGPDPAVGDRATKQALAQLLQGELSFHGDGWYKLDQLVPIIESGYLLRWAGLLRQPQRPGAERVARAVAAHLLRGGFSSTYLHRWLDYQAKGNALTLSIADVLEEAERDLVQRPMREFQVIFPVAAAPGMGGEIPPGWRSAADVAAEIEKIQGSRTDARQSGGFVLSLAARDHFAAVEMARDLVDRWNARAELSTGKGLRCLEMAWVEGVPNPIPSLPQWRHVNIGALALEKKVYTSLDDHPLSVRIDDALQLVQPMQAGSRSAAISGGWAAIEALLTQGIEPDRAAYKLACIVACSYPRAELTSLSYVHSRHGNDELSRSLGVQTENLKRARMVADAIANGATLAVRGPQDIAASVRMKEVLTQPGETLRKVRDYVKSSLNRLYRQRNLTVHGGRVSGAGRSETLRTVPALVGAGLDRIVHAWFAEGTTPLELAARADLSLELVGAANGPHPTDLLEPR